VTSVALDASTLLAMLLGEPGGEKVEADLAQMSTTQAATRVPQFHMMATRIHRHIADNLTHLKLLACDSLQCRTPL
jgi:PIN domain nuclease of toxin-antitoxin system